jgi:Domain of unknown function (DUF222)
MFEQKGYGFDPETDGFYPSTLPSFPEQPASSRELNRNVYEAFAVLQQAHVALADAVTEWDMADAWAFDGALNASAWLRNKLGVSNGSANSMLTFARRTSLLAPSVREAVREGVLSTDKANQILHCFTKKRAEHVDRDVDTLIRSASQLTVNQTRFMMINWAATVDAEIESASDDIEPEDATIKNELFISETIDGMTVMQGQFDAESAKRFAPLSIWLVVSKTERLMRSISPPIMRTSKPIPTIGPLRMRNPLMNVTMRNNAPMPSV